MHIQMSRNCGANESWQIYLLRHFLRNSYRSLFHINAFTYKFNSPKNSFLFLSLSSNPFEMSISHSMLFIVSVCISRECVCIHDAERLVVCVKGTFHTSSYFYFLLLCPTCSCFAHSLLIESHKHKNKRHIVVRYYAYSYIKTETNT